MYLYLNIYIDRKSSLPDGSIKSELDTFRFRIIAKN